MYARTTLLEIDTVRISIDDADKVFTETVLPVLREQPGFVGMYGFANADGKAMLVSFWETAEQAEAGRDQGFYPELLEEYLTLFRSPPGRATYEVRIAVPPVPAGADR